MAEPRLVADCGSAMLAAAIVPMTVKHRVGTTSAFFMI